VVWVTPTRGWGGFHGSGGPPGTARARPCPRRRSPPPERREDASMLTKDLRRLLQRLNGHLTRALEAAAGYAINRSHYEVTLEHLLAKLAEDATCDLPNLLHHYEVDAAQFWKLLQGELEVLKSGNTGKPSFSPELLELFEQAWVLASVEHELAQIRTGVVVEAMLESPRLRNVPYLEPLRKIS